MGKIKSILRSVRWTKAVVQFENSYKTPARILDVGMMSNYLRLVFASF